MIAGLGTVAEQPVVFPRPDTTDRCLPGHHIELSGGEPRLVTPDTIDSTSGAEFGGLLALGDWLPAAADPNTAERARAAATAAVVDRFHEVLEWTHVDGEPLAAAHPGGLDEEGAWAFLAEAVSRTLDAYIATWPAAPRTGGAVAPACAADGEGICAGVVRDTASREP